MKTIFTIIITLIVTGMPSKEGLLESNIQNCNAELTVEKDRSFKSADEDGAQFKLTLTNKSNSKTSYKVGFSKLSSSCSNETKTNSNNRMASKNSDLNVSFEMNGNNMSKHDSKHINSITLDAGQSQEFMVNAFAPEGTTYNTWGCIKVEANSINCESVSAEIILSIYIPDPTEE